MRLFYSDIVLFVCLAHVREFSNSAFNFNVTREKDICLPNTEFG